MPLIVPLIGSFGTAVAPCLTHCVSPDCPAIMAIAFGDEGVSSVANILSKIVNRLAYCQKNGIVSQSICAMTRRANCLPILWAATLPDWPEFLRNDDIVGGEAVHFCDAVDDVELAREPCVRVIGAVLERRISVGADTEGLHARRYCRGRQCRSPWKPGVSAAERGFCPSE